MRFIKIIILFLLPACAIAQAVNSDVFFQNVLQDLTEAEVLQIDAVHFPWVEELIVRTETRDFDLGRQEYTLRVKPGSIKKRRAQAALLDHYKNLPDEESLDRYGDVVLNLYSDWISLYFQRQLVLTYDSLQMVWKDKRQVLNKKIGALDVDFDELKDLEIDKNRLSQAQFELGLERAGLLARYDLSEENLDFDELLSLEEIEQRLARDVLSGAGARLDDKLSFEKAEIEKELALEQAEQRDYFDFVQFRYRGPHGNPFEEKLAVGLGFNLENDGNRKLKVARLMQEKRVLDREAKDDYQKRSLEANQVRGELQMSLKIAQHFIELKRAERENLSEIERLVKKKNGFDPMLILEIKEHQLKERLKEIRYKQDIYFDYIKFLSTTSQLSRLPFQNHIRA